MNGTPRTYRITRIRDAEAREVTGRAVDPAALEAPARAAGGTRSVGAPAAPGRPFAAVLDVSLPLPGATVLQWLAVAGRPWRGCMVVWRSADGLGFDTVATVDAPSLMARLLAPLPAGPCGRWDRAGGVEIQLPASAPPTGADMAALSGATALAIRGPDGAWEVLAYARSELVGPSRWRLTRLLRGLSGTEEAASRDVPAGSLAVLLDASLVPLAAGPENLGRAFRYRVGPAARGAGDPAALAFEAAPGPGALLPLAPVRASARRTSAGVALRWIRRGRLEADAWEPVEIPLGEAAERYEVDVLAGGVVKRTLSCPSPEALYPADAERADFGAPQASLWLRIVQLSAAVGRGRALAVTLPVL